ncbi:TRAP transporter small permease subunit [Rubrivivax sp. JA1024]|nr:TRAP transporter small permease subunit [Rubrivivax sp. JA1024]
MSALLRLSRLIDAINEFVGRHLAWLVLVMVLISATNAVARKAFAVSSNAFLEIQWYLFAAVFLLAAGYTMLRQEHVRIDVVLGRFQRRTQVVVEAVCIVLFLMPFGLLVIDLVLPLVIKAYETGEMSSNAGGLIRWPVYALVPVGFTLLLLQGVSEFIKRIAFLRGLADDPGRRGKSRSDEEELAAFLRQQADGAKK